MIKEGNKIPNLTKRRVREQLADEIGPKTINLQLVESPPRTRGFEPGSTTILVLNVLPD